MRSPAGSGSAIPRASRKNLFPIIMTSMLLVTLLARCRARASGARRIGCRQLPRPGWSLRSDAGPPATGGRQGRRATSCSCARVRAPMTGTMVSPLARTQAMASCAGRIPRSSASVRVRQPRRAFCARRRTLNRGRRARKSPAAATVEPLSRPRESAPYMTPMPSSASTGRMRVAPRLTSGIDLQIRNGVRHGPGEWCGLPRTIRWRV